MKTVIISSILAASALAAPTDYTPKGGWESVNYPKDAGANLKDYPAPKGGWESVDYPKDAGANLKDYPAPKGGWESVDYSGKDKACPDPFFTFTSRFHTVATPDQVVNGSNVATGGLSGTTGYYDFAINSDLDLICWNIKLVGFRGNYTSPAKTATHVHEAAKGKTGPPRLAFPNPIGEGHERYSRGCMTGPFTTGLIQNGSDTATGFKVKQIEQNPHNFFADVHSSLAVPGAVRGQLA